MTSAGVQNIAKPCESHFITFQLDLGTIISILPFGLFESALLWSADERLTQTQDDKYQRLDNMSESKGSNGRMFRDRFHSRGLSNRYKHGSPGCLSSSPNSCLLDVLKSPVNAQNQADRVSEGHGLQTDCTATVQGDAPACTTPTISQRKLLLTRKQRAPQDPSHCQPNLVSTPGLARVKAAIKDKLDMSHLTSSFKLESEGGSPGLMHLRLTPGRPLKEKQKVLADKHEETRCNADTLNIGGGVSLWPGMEDMRLGKGEFIKLCLTSALLVLATCSAFHIVHGSTLQTIEDLHADVRLFAVSHPINLSSSALLSTTCLRWHEDFTHLTAKIRRSFAIMACNSSPYMFYTCSILYISGICILLFYLVDNMTSNNRLSPTRIKKWVYLLLVIGAWTISSVRLISGAFFLELSVERAIEALAEQQRMLAYHTYSTQTYDHVVRYWSLKYLSPTSQGILTVLDIIQFKTVIYYMQYYSLPVLTALLSPVIKLFLAVLHVYGLVETSDQLC